MQILLWCFRVAVFLLLFAFAIKNDGLVTVRVFFGEQWQLPLILVMLSMFLGGVLLGATATLGTLLSQQREIQRLKKAADAANRGQAKRLRNPPPDLPEIL